MSETIEELKAQRVSLKAALRSGALSVRHGDKQVMYRSVDEIRKALESLEQDIAKAEGKRRRRITYLEIGRGY